MSTDLKIAGAFALIVAAWVALIWATTPRGPDDRPRSSTTRRPN